jgi:peptide/nickel transport system permease protein
VKDRRLIVGGGFVLLLGLVALLAPWLGLRDPSAQPDGLVLRDLPPLSRPLAIRLASGRTRYAQELRERSDGSVEYRRGRQWHELAPSELADDWRRRPLFVLGTDNFGRDLLSRLIYGGRISLLLGLSAAGIALVIGTLVGLLAAVGGGWVETLLMGLTDLMLSIPRLFLALMLVALHGPSLITTVVVLAFTTWMAAARLVRGEILAVRELEFVSAARAAGAPPLRIVTRHLLPAVVVPITVESTLRVGDTILLEATLSFLGLGVPPPVPSWGNLVADGRDSLLDAWWIATLPGLAIAATIIALHLLGDAARDRFDPLSRQSASRFTNESRAPATPVPTFDVECPPTRSSGSVDRRERPRGG